MLPIARPIIMTLGIFSFQWRWKDYIWPLLVLNDPKKYTLQVAIRSLVGAENINWTILIAASVISILPLLLVFLAFQRWILDSNLDSGLKEKKCRLLRRTFLLLWMNGVTEQRRFLF
ncbi:hypothetical protein ENLAB_07770 [Enterococcus innesii]|uniref:ABC transmembrane type-1 domain-containing protein n=2 Tax=Enterococcus innesii TaxID=2839759 RepID=A0ABN6NQ98_9ENTE|nr:hypothetical protein ENLAB_07770 [Enterococcus innesii]